MNFIDYLKKYESYPELFDVLINIYLVHMDQRLSTLIEYNNFTNQSLLEVKNIIEEYILMLQDPEIINIKEDTDYRYLIYKKSNYYLLKNMTLGQKLEFYCYDHANFDDDKLERCIFRIEEIKTNTNIYTEVCEAKLIDLGVIQFLDAKVNKWNSVFENYSFRLVVQYDDGTLKRLEKVDDPEYVKGHVKLYLNDLYNYYVLDEDLLNNLELFKIVYILSVKYEVWDILFQNYDYEQTTELLKNFNRDLISVYLTSENIYQSFKNVLKFYHLKNMDEILNILKGVKI